MASITDELVTVLRLVGQHQYAQGMMQAAAAAQALAVSQQQQTAAARQVAGAMKTSLAADVMVAAAAFGMLEGAIRGAIEAGMEFEKATVRTGVMFRNQGVKMSGAQGAELANQLSTQTGTSSTDILNTEAYLARFHVNASMIPRDMRIIIDAANATGKSTMEMAHAIEMAHMGSSRALRDMGIPVHALNGQLIDMNSLFAAINREVHGMTEAMLRTSAGQFDRMINSWNQLMKSMQGVNSGALYVIFKSIADILDIANKHASGLQRSMEAIAALTLIIRYGWAGVAAAIGLVGFLEGSKAFNNRAASAANGVGGSRAEEYARQTAFNTGPEGPLGKAVRAGGSFGEAGGGLRIRDWNQMARHIA